MHFLFSDESATRAELEFNDATLQGYLHLWHCNKRDTDMMRRRKDRYLIIIMILIIMTVIIIIIIIMVTIT